MTRLLLALVAGYRRFLSPLLPPRCRFHPTCSAYAAAALTEHGAARGSWLAVRRVARCHPFHPGGHDPVPSRQGGAADPADPVLTRTAEIGDTGARTASGDLRGSAVPRPVLRSGAPRA